MDRYEKSAEFIMKRGDAVIAERKRRKAIIMRSAALSLGAAAIIGVGICANALKPPKKPTADNSSMIIETTAVTSAETTEKTTAQPERPTSKPVHTAIPAETDTSAATTAITTTEERIRTIIITVNSEQTESSSLEKSTVTIIKNVTTTHSKQTHTSVDNSVTSTVLSSEIMSNSTTSTTDNSSSGEEMPTLDDFE